MDQKALQKARLRLRVVRKSVEEMKASKTYGEFSETWYIFLHAAKGIYTTLEQGAKANVQARQWFAKKNRERKDDPLLRYVTEARNDDEHGIELTTEYVPGSAQLGVTRPGSSRLMVDDNGNVYSGNTVAAVYHVEGPPPNFPLPKLRALDGKPVVNEVIAPQIRMVTVHDRSGRPYGPPASHLGTAIPDSAPRTVAKLMASYLEQLVGEAEGFHRP